MAAWALGEIGSPQAVDALVGALKDASWEVRAKAAWALGEIGDRRAADPLAASMKDAHPAGPENGGLGAGRDAG